MRDAAAGRIRDAAAEEARRMRRLGLRAVAMALCARARRKAAALAEIVLYTIRHTMATEMMARGVPELEIAGFLGHAMPNIRTTGRYVKARPEYLAHAVKAVEDVLVETSQAAARPIVPCV
jgi:site-specific recombinase XerD